MALNVHFLRWNMPACFLTNHYFSETTSVVQKCQLRRLISENTRKITSRMTLLISRKMEKISCSVWCAWKRWTNSFFKAFQLKQHLNNAQKEQASKSIEYLKSREGCLKCVRLDAGATGKVVVSFHLLIDTWLFKVGQSF